MSESHAQCSREESVFQSPASYYNPATKKWQDGLFTLYQRYVDFFSEETSEEPPFHLSLPLTTLSGIKKKYTYFFYSALVIEVGGETHWFSSFESRDCAYNLVELFWRNSLLDSQSSSTPLESISNPLQNRLMAMLLESESNLAGSARSLCRQDEQLDHLHQDVADMNDELSISEDVMRNLGAPKCSTIEISNSIASCSDAPCQTLIFRQKHHVTFTSSEKPSCSSSEWERGFLLLTTELELLDERSNTKVSIPSHEIKDIAIVSPWQICVTQRCKPSQVQYHIMFPTLSKFLKMLRSRPTYGDKLVYLGDTEDVFQHTSSTSSSSKSSTSTESVTIAELSEKIQRVGRCIGPNISNLLQQVRSAQGSGTLTDEDAVQLISQLNKLELLGAEVYQEQECNMEKIKKLINEVEKTELRLHSVASSMRKLI